MKNNMLESLKIKIFTDGADLKQIADFSQKPYVKGFTTNPTLMKQAGVLGYQSFAKEAISIVGGKPISFEVFADDLQEMERQARVISSWGENVYVKIPITNTKGQSTVPLIKSLSSGGIKLNITAILTKKQIVEAHTALNKKVPSIISYFAGRVADTGVDPTKTAREAAKIVGGKSELLWASSREVINILQAQKCGCNIITVTPELLKKAEAILGKDLEQLSLDTVKMFYNDGLASGFDI